MIQFQTIFLIIYQTIARRELIDFRKIQFKKTTYLYLYASFVVFISSFNQMFDEL